MPDFGLLFDLDGTLVDTDHLHFAAFNTLLREHGREIDMPFFKERIMGAANATLFPELFPGLDAAAHAELADRKEALFRDATPTMEPIAGLGGLVAWARAHGVPMGAVTNAPRLNAEHMLRALGLDDLIAGVVIGDEVAHPKPHPLPYRTGAARLGLAPERVFAFEDSRSGVRSAVDAGTRTVALTTGLDRDTLTALGAEMVIDDYRAPALWAALEAALAGPTSP